MPYYGSVKRAESCSACDGLLGQRCQRLSIFTAKRWTSRASAVHTS